MKRSSDALTARIHAIRERQRSQEARGATPLSAGLLMVPQGIGAALAMPVAGRLVDRIGGGRVALGGCTVMTLATLPLAALHADTPTLWLQAVLLIRGVGLGASMMPTMAAAYARLDTGQVPRATSALNAIQRTGGSIGTALLAVVLEHEARTAGAVAAVAGHPVPTTARPNLDAPLAATFGHTFAWAVGIGVLAILSAGALALTERSPAGRRVPAPSS